jgi:hypothetical protein
MGVRDDDKPLLVKTHDTFPVIRDTSFVQRDEARRSSDARCRPFKFDNTPKILTLTYSQFFLFTVPITLDGAW